MLYKIAFIICILVIVCSPIIVYHIGGYEEMVKFNIPMIVIWIPGFIFLGIHDNPILFVKYSVIASMVCWFVLILRKR